MTRIDRDELISQLESVVQLFRKMAQVAIAEHDIISMHTLIGYGNMV